jgi:hypothetical protein
MMGTKLRAFAPLCNRSLEDLVPTSNFYRHLEAKLDLGSVRDLVRTTYKECGRVGREKSVRLRPRGNRRGGVLRAPGERLQVQTRRTDPGRWAAVASSPSCGGADRRCRSARTP